MPLSREEIDDVIDAWHDGDGAGMALHEHLGWTWDEYKRWAEGATVTKRKHSVPRWVVMWEPPPHQQIISGDHPHRHGCKVCTTHFAARVDARRFTRWGAERAHARRVLSWRVGRFWIEAR